MNLKCAIFDFDGTLADTAPGICAALNKVLDEHHLPNISVAEGKAMIGGGVRHLVTKLKEHSPAFERLPEIDELATSFHKFYEHTYLQDVRLFEGVARTLREAVEVQGSGFRLKLAMLSNKPERYIHPMLKPLGLDEFAWVTIIGGDTFEVKKPDPLVFRKCLQAIGCEPEEALMVGDSEPDVLGAKAAGIRVCGVTFGYTPTSELRTLRPDYIVDRFEQLRFLLRPELALGT